MPLVSTPVAIAALGSIVAGSWAAGAGGGISIFTIPPLLVSGGPQDLLLCQWQMAYQAGRRIMPRVVGLAALGYFYAAWQQRSLGGEWRGLAGAGALTVAVAPFTFAFIMPTNNALEGEIARATKTMGRTTAEGLLEGWGRLNLLRSLLPLAGIACAVWNLVV